ncbi:MAG: hypothetical protein ACTIC7_11405 [Lactiplantibacillus plantarum]|jgi:hypothetical protein
MADLIDQDYFMNDYHGDKTIDTERWLKLEMTAEDVINELTFNYFMFHDLSELCVSDQILVKKATAAEVEYLAQLKTPTELAGNGEVTSIHAGNVTKSYSNVTKSRDNVLISRRAVHYLRFTGLLYRGVHNG